MNAVYLDWIKRLAVFFLGISVGTSIGLFNACSAVLAIIASIFDKNRFCNLKNKLFNRTFLLFNMYIITILAECLFFKNDIGIKMILRYYDKIATFFILYLFIGNCSRIFQYAFLGSALGFLCNDYIVFTQMLSGPSEFGNRYGGFFGNPNMMSSMFELAVPLFCFAMYKFRKDMVLLFIGVVSLVGVLWSLYMSGSRGATMAVVVEAVLFLLIHVYRTNKNTSLLKYVGIGIVAGILVIVATAVFFQRSYDSERILLWISSINMFIDHPIFGVGFSNWGKAYVSHYISPLAQEPCLNHPHNLYLILLSETGLVGFVSFFSFIIWQVKESLKYSEMHYRVNGPSINIGDMFIIMIVGALIHNMVEINMVLRDFMLMYFYIWGICCIEFKRNDKKSRLE